MGSRHVVYAEISSNFHAETALATVIACLRRIGLIGKLTFDHDPRWVGSPSGRDFPSAFHGQAFARTVQPNGRVVVDHRSYYAKQALAGRKVVLLVNAPEQRFEVLLGKEVVKSVSIKGLVGQALPFDEYAARMQAEARSEYRRWLQQQRRLQQLSLWAS